MGVLGGNKYFSVDYVTARHRFLKACRAHELDIESIPFDAKGPDGEDLFLDLAWMGPRDAKRVVVVSSGIHGIEGYFGSAVQLALLSEGALELEPGTALVFQHALNPYGFAHRRRVNEDNMDLNRNLLRDGESYSGAPDGYAELDEMLNPPTVPGRFAVPAFLFQAVRKIARSGMDTLKGIVAGGQYVYPKGLFFGGRGPSQTLRVLREHVPGWFGEVDHLLQVDFHTGLGKSATYKLLIDHTMDTGRARWLVERFGAAIEPWDGGDEGVAYAIRGGLGTWMQAALPDATVDVLCAEFGTKPPLSVIVALHLENRVHLYGEPGTVAYESAKQRMMDTFVPSDAGWRDAVVDKGHRIVQQALSAV